MTNLTTVIRVIDEEASLDHVNRYRSHRPGLHFEHYSYGNFDRSSRTFQVYGFLIAVIIAGIATALAGILQ